MKVSTIKKAEKIFMLIVFWLPSETLFQNYNQLITKIVFNYNLSFYALFLQEKQEQKS